MTYYLFILDRFQHADAFNQDISLWDTSQVTTMQGMWVSHFHLIDTIFGTIIIKTPWAYYMLFILFGIGFITPEPSTKTFRHGILHGFLQCMQCGFPYFIS